MATKHRRIENVSQPANDGIRGMASVLWPVVLACLTIQELRDVERACRAFRQAVCVYARGPAGRCTLRFRMVPKRLHGSMVDSYDLPHALPWSRRSKAVLSRTEDEWRHTRYWVPLRYWSFQAHRYRFEETRHSERIGLLDCTWSKLRATFASRNPDCIVIPIGYLEADERRILSEMDGQEAILKAGASDLRGVLLPRCVRGNTSRSMADLTPTGLTLWVHPQDQDQGQGQAPCTLKERVQLPMSTELTWLDVFLLVAFELKTTPDKVKRGGLHDGNPTGWSYEFLSNRIAPRTELCVVAEVTVNFGGLVFQTLYLPEECPRCRSIARPTALKLGLV